MNIEPAATTVADELRDLEARLVRQRRLADVLRRLSAVTLPARVTDCQSPIADRQRMSVRAMVSASIPEMPEVFGAVALRDRCVTRYPAEKQKIRRGFYLACQRLFASGELKRGPDEHTLAKPDPK